MTVIGFPQGIESKQWEILWIMMIYLKQGKKCSSKVKITLLHYRSFHENHPKTYHCMVKIWNNHESSWTIESVHGLSYHHTKTCKLHIDKKKKKKIKNLHFTIFPFYFFSKDKDEDLLLLRIYLNKCIKRVFFLLSVPFSYGSTTSNLVAQSPLRWSVAKKSMKGYKFLFIFTTHLRWSKIKGSS